MVKFLTSCFLNYSYPNLCSFLHYLGLDHFGGMHTSVNSAWNFVEALDEHLVNCMREKLAKCPFFGISLDESTSRSIEKYLSCDSHAWLPGVGRTVDVLEFTVLGDCTSQGVYDCTIKILEKFGILDKEKFVGAASDGASVFTGAFHVTF